MLPNLIVIGAGKAGTTSLHYYLDQHPDVYMSRTKELFFFQRPNWRERIEWYESCFPTPASVRGEASPSYSAHPVHPDVPARIHELIPDARLIYMVRDPITRIEAQYAQHLSVGKESRLLANAIEQALEHGDDPVNPYLCMSHYATQVEQYLEYFPLERMLVIDLVDLQRDPRAVLREAFAFLGIDERFDSPRFDQVLNTKRDQVAFSPLGAKLRDSRLAQLVKQRMPRELRGPVTKPLTRMLSQPVDRPVLSEGLRAELTAALGPEVERLRELTGKPFAEWSL